MNHNQKEKKMAIFPKRFETWHKVALWILSTVSILSLSWGNLAVPRINKMICDYTTPHFNDINDALEYNNCLHMVMMSDSQLQRALELYKQCKMSKGVQLTGIKR